MVITIAFDRDFNLKPGIHRSRNTVFRVWWLWFAVAVYRRDEYWLVTERHDWSEYFE